MAKSGDDQKRRLWRERLTRFQTSGLTVARFCREEQVSVCSFYYWVKQIGRTDAAEPRTTRTMSKAAARCDVARPAERSDAFLRFRFPRDVEVVVPAHCLDAVRCLMQCVGGDVGSPGDAFRELVVRSRDEAR